MDHLPNMNKAYYIVQQIEKQNQVTSHNFDPSKFFVKTSNSRENSNVRRVVKHTRDYVRYELKKKCTNCG